jgi:shikimate kinase
MVVWLDMAVDDIVQRLQGSEEEVAKRPLLRGDDVSARLHGIYEDRKAMYEQVSQPAAAERGKERERVRVLAAADKHVALVPE